MVSPRYCGRDARGEAMSDGGGGGDGRNGARKLGLQGWLGLRDGLLSAFGGVLAYARAQSAAAGDPAGDSNGDPSGDAAGNPAGKATAADPAGRAAVAVHEFRKSVRRARAVIRLLRPLIDEPEYAFLEQELRGALGAASGLRDADVLLGTLRAHPVRPGSPEAAAARAAAKALEARVAALRAGPPASVVLAEGAARLAPLPDALGAALPRALTPKDVARGLARLFRRAEKALRDARRDACDETIHDWRKRVKELRYALELLDAAAGGDDPGRPAAASPPRETGLRRTAAQLAEGLGQVTDLIVLHRELLALEAPGDKGGLETLAARVEDRVQAGFREMVRLSRPLFGGKPRAVADAIVAAAVKTPRGPSRVAAAPPPLVRPRTAPAGPATTTAPARSGTKQTPARPRATKATTARPGTKKTPARPGTTKRPARPRPRTTTRRRLT